MKFPAFLTVMTLCLSACGHLHSHEKATQSQAQQVGLVSLHKSRFDSAYSLPDANFGQYKKIILGDLDLASTKILKPSSSRMSDEPWELKDGDKKYYQTKYANAAQKYLFEDGVFSAATVAAPDTLLLKTKIIEIAPLASKDDFKGRPNLMDVYSEGFGRMTIAFELYDSVSNKMVATISDEHELGTMWEKNNRAQNNMQIKLAFDYWMRNLKRQLRGL